jgi:hypothetical protein
VFLHVTGKDIILMMLLIMFIPFRIKRRARLLSVISKLRLKFPPVGFYFHCFDSWGWFIHLH